MNKENYLTTGQLAKRTGITVRTLRYYDKVGLMFG
ncbi:MerR family DNA-binding transcriptional regulator [Paenibacillus donghaensis]|nr:MerR family DNA-binding transcriptional regulator [Paenibacillus donghaensis]